MLRNELSKYHEVRHVEHRYSPPLNGLIVWANYKAVYPSM